MKDCVVATKNGKGIRNFSVVFSILAFSVQIAFLFRQVHTSDYLQFQVYSKGNDDPSSFFADHPVLATPKEKEKRSVWSLSFEELMASSTTKPSQCNNTAGFYYMADHVSSEDVWSRKIPKVVHVTGFTRCLTKNFEENVNKWKLPGHSFYFHDEEAVDRLMQEFWPEFPQLQLIQNCLISGAAKADLWRLLVLYRYGGIYSDMDNAPTSAFFPSGINSTIISDDDDAFFLIERQGLLTQWFLAASPRHPIIYLSVLKLFDRLMTIPETIGKMYAPFVTGPGALKAGFIAFMGGNATGHVSEGGQYFGKKNRSITVYGKSGKASVYVRRESVTGKKKSGGYKEMGMQHFSKVKGPRSDKKRRHTSCIMHLYDITGPTEHDTNSQTS